MRMINPAPVSFTTHHLFMGYTSTDIVISTGTGFIYARNDDFYLITNWHNVTGRDPATLECLSDKMAVPDVVVTYFLHEREPITHKVVQIKLYTDEDMQIPLWLEHPVHGKSVDVVAIKLKEAIVNSCKLFPINQIKFDEATERVADEIFVVGYPFGEATYPYLPIWKKASIASEPDIDIDQLPKFLIDTATRPGLSGSPVMMQRTGIHGFVDGEPTPDSLIGTIRKFSGVYSGRIGDDEAKAQLGIVWKAKVIDEIIDGGLV